MIIAGFDISTYTGLAFLDTETQECTGRLIHFPDHKGMVRLGLIEKELRRILAVRRCDKIILEGYAIHHVSSVVSVVSCGTVVRQVLYSLGYPWLEVPPTTLKKWASGKGNAKKADMAIAVKDRWGYSSPSDDIIDAVALARLGEYLETVGDDHNLKGLSLIDHT